MSTAKFTRLVLWEYRRIARDPFGIALAVGWCGLLALAAWLGVERVSSQWEEIETLRARDEAAWAEKRSQLIAISKGEAEPKPFQDPRSPTNSVMGQSAARPVAAPPSVLASLAVGPGDLAPVVLEVGLLTKLRQAPESVENPANRLTGSIDFNFVIGTLAPLFLLALGFDALARDRDTRVMALLGSQPTPLKRVVWARLSAHGLFVGGTLAIAGFVATLSTGRDFGASLLETVAWLALAWTYLWLWLGAIAWVNFKAWDGATNAVALCGLWLVSTLLLPAITQSLVDRVAPAPDIRSAILETRRVETRLFKSAAEIRDAYWEADPRRKPRSQLNEYDTYYVESLWPRVLAGNAALEAVHSRVDEAAKLRRDWWRRLGWLSPTLAFRLATERLAGSAPEQRAELRREAKRYQNQARGHFELKLASMSPLELSDYDTMPPVPIVAFSFGNRLYLAWPAICGIVAVAMVFGVLLYRAKEPKVN